VTFPLTVQLPRGGSDGGASATYLALLSFLPLKSARWLPSFFGFVLRIQKQLATAPGLIGYSMRTEILRLRPLSVWESEAAVTSCYLARIASDEPAA